MLRDSTILLISMLCFGFLKSILLSRATTIFAEIKHIDFKNSSLIKFRIALWKFQYYMVSAAYGTYLMATEDWVLESSKYAHAYSSYPFAFRIYYLISIAFYFSEIIALVLEPKHTDFFQMVFHHVTTISLLLLSYNHNLTRFGIIILFIHDIGDPFMELAKICVHLKKQKLANLFFALFACVFFVSRLIIYPIFIVRPAIICLLSHRYHVWSISIGMLLVFLVIVHVIWMTQILKLGYVFIFSDSQRAIQQESKKNS